MTSKSKYEKLKGHTRSSCAPNMVQLRLLFPELRHFGKNGARHFSLIGRHLETARSTKLVIELVRSLGDRRTTCEFWSDLGDFSPVIVVTAQESNIFPEVSVGAFQIWLLPPQRQTDMSTHIIGTYIHTRPCTFVHTYRPILNVQT